MWTIVDTPVGPLRVVAATALTASSSSASPRLVDRVLARPPPGRGRHVATASTTTRCWSRRAASSTAYFASELKDFDLPLQPTGTHVPAAGLGALREIGYGETVTYGEIAGRLGMTGHGSRAVGLANGRNPIPIVIPCHRVVGADGILTGYAGGVDRKQRCSTSSRPPRCSDPAGWTRVLQEYAGIPRHFSPARATQ